MDVPFNQAVLTPFLTPSAQSLDSLPIVSGSTNPEDYGASQQHETRTNIDSTPLMPRIETPTPFLPPPSGWISQSTRLYTRPCRCGKSECMWQFIYLDQMMLATHEVLGSLPPTPTRHPNSTNPPPPRLSSHQKETFYVSSVEGPIFNIHKTFATPIIPGPDRDETGLLRFLEREPWADMRPDKLVCLGCGCDVGADSPWSWICHRNSCEGIDNAILRSVVDVWEAEVAGPSLIEEF
ncbi:uncharacterized protein ARMOST_12251 [Armillaria ostoyae]|uniref:Uncharacterized protein n=1 Tax=Armillaria ostoyae TaxID=47428 RepID=A0A284RJD6_ARMOS|nr:uncharacterized protein ARMOST_12251 [Armillaria ostoyae]